MRWQHFGSIWRAREGKVFSLNYFSSFFFFFYGVLVFMFTSWSFKVKKSTCMYCQKHITSHDVSARLRLNWPMLFLWTKCVTGKQGSNTSRVLLTMFCLGTLIITTSYSILVPAFDCYLFDGKFWTQVEEKNVVSFRKHINRSGFLFDIDTLLWVVSFSTKNMFMVLNQKVVTKAFILFHECQTAPQKFFTRLLH